MKIEEMMSLIRHGLKRETNVRIVDGSLRFTKCDGLWIVLDGLEGIKLTIVDYVDNRINQTVTMLYSGEFKGKEYLIEFKIDYWFKACFSEVEFEIYIAIK